MLAIYKKEMRAYFTTPMGYIFLAVAMFISSLIFAISTYFSESPTADLSTYFTTMVFVMSIFVPILTMRSFSDEKRTKTDQLLFTSPVSVFSLVMGKFLSAFSVFLIYIVISLLNLIPTYAHVAMNASGPSVAMLLGNLIALILVGMVFIAIGIFASTLTENPAVSLIITFGILALFLVLGIFTTYLNIEAQWVRVLFDWLSIYSRYVNFANGYFDIEALIYYLSLTFIFLFLSERVFKIRRLG